jgi:hypothetical protein
MPESTIYGLAGLAAMLLIAFYFAYADKSSPAAGASSERIDDPRQYDSQRIETRPRNLAFPGEVGQQKETARASCLQTPASTLAVRGTIYSGNRQSDGGQGEVLHG